MRGIRLGVMLGAIWAAPVLGQEDALHGPAVPDQAIHTIVRHDARGNFLPVEGRPEAAAIVVLGLDPTELARARDQVTDRTVALNVLLIEGVETVRRATDLIRAGKRADAEAIVRELQEKFDASRARDPLKAALDKVLTTAQQAELSRVLDQYWKEWIDWELRRAKDQSDAARQKTQDRLSFRVFQGEVQQAYERTLKPYRDRLEAMETALDPTPEQREAIRGAVVEYIKTTRLAPSPEQRREMLNRIYGMLDEGRRAKLFDLVARQLGGER